MEKKREERPFAVYLNFCGDYRTFSDKLIFEYKTLWCIYIYIRIFFQASILIKFIERGISKFLTMILYQINSFEGSTESSMVQAKRT